MPRAKYRAFLAASESAANEKAIYGEMLPMITFIRSRGWVSFREGQMYRIGTKLLTAEGVADVYRRERERENRRSAERLVASGPEGADKASHSGDYPVPRRPDNRGGSKGDRQKATRPRSRAASGTQEEKR